MLLKNPFREPSVGARRQGKGQQSPIVAGVPKAFSKNPREDPLQSEGLFEPFERSVFRQYGWYRG